MSRLVFSTVEALAEEFVRRTEAAAAAAIAARGTFTCALTGGSTLRHLYPPLARARLDWARVHFYYGDERCVPFTHPQSNHGQALAVLGRTGARFHPIEGEAPPEDAAEAYEQALPHLDLVHLGVGPDGHVCSLFPGHRLLLERSRRVACLTDAPKPPPRRVTLTLPALAEAGSLWLVAFGAEKREAIAVVLEAPASMLPAALATRGAAEPLWYLDIAAAGRLADEKVA